VVGLAGPTGSGKDSLLEVFKDLGFRVEDMDAWGHLALEALKSELARIFGPDIISPDGKVNRRTLGDKVFASPGALGQLEALVHPWMKEKIQELLRDSHQELWVLNAAILHKLGMEELCQRIIWVTAPTLQRLFRVKIRGNLSFTAAVRRLWAQKNLSPKQFSRKVDILIKNKNGELEKSRDLIRKNLRLWMKQ